MIDPTLEATGEAVRAAAEAHARQKRLAAQRRTTTALVADRRDELAELEEALQSEQSDVRRLEEPSLAKVWATLRGNVTDRLARERAEADAAALAVAAASARLDSALADDARVRRELEAFHDTGRAYDDALAAHEAALHAVGGHDAAELTGVAEQLGAAEARKREVAEAIVALRAARTALDDALRKLESAGGWSTYDTFFGGGLISDIAKHTRIDEATEAFVSVNRALERLSVELADIGVSTIDGVEMSTTLAVFDVMFDNILSDWMVKERIRQAQTSARNLSRRLNDLACNLDAEAGEIASRIDALHKRREEILTSV